MRKTFFAIFLLSTGLNLFSQESADSTSNGVLNRIFLPSVDVGYQVPNSDLIGGSLKFSTSLEYRIRNNNDFFIRLNYDTFGVPYELSQTNPTSNTIKGTVQMTDISLGPGYRVGDSTFRLMFGFLPGIRLYEFPTAIINGQEILINQESKSLFTTSILVTLEYYFDEKSAFTLSLFQNQVWRDIDFWIDGRSALGISVGFITSLI